MTPTQQRQLQRLQKNEDWLALEEFIKEFKLNNFVEDSIKRDNEFETMWNAAEKEGGKNTLNQFFEELENEAKQV